MRCEGCRLDPIADLELLLRRAIFAWLIADGDMHLKNLALPKTARVGSRTFTSVRLAPLYDAVSTRVFPKLANDRMALKLNGKDDRLTRADFRAAAATLGIPVSRAEASCSELVEILAAKATRLHLPAFVRREAKATCDAFVEIVESLLPEGSICPRSPDARSGDAPPTRSCRPRCAASTTRRSSASSSAAFGAGSPREPRRSPDWRRRSRHSSARTTTARWS